jgi:hypothetical protein
VTPGRPFIAVLLGAVAALAPATAEAGRQSTTVTVSAHLRSDYRWSIDNQDTSDPECVTTSSGQSRVITDMTTVRPATYRITRVRGGFVLRKRRGGGQKDAKGIDMRITQTRSTSGSTKTCRGEFPVPTDGCGTRRWELAVTPGFEPGTRRVGMSLQEIFDTTEEDLAHQDHLQSGCGIDGNADIFITQTRSTITGRLQEEYHVSVPHGRFFSRSPRRFTASGSSTFRTNDVTSIIGGWTETRTTELVVRKR